MSKYTNLFKFIELTRSQPQYGYALSGMRPQDLSNLAEHHYLVTFITWQLCRMLKKEGIEIDMAQALEYSLVHDLGELFGGDIAMPYARINPAAKEKAKAFEAENQKFITGMFGEDEKEYILNLFAEDRESTNLESVVAKIADYIEVTHFKDYMKMFTADDVVLVKGALSSRIAGLQDPKAKDVLMSFIEEWSGSLPGSSTRELLTQMVKEK